ncbi:MAG: hypothetical protein IIB09_02235 [Bacteroidetes bacterium]|nr:hypothetical protein [Bacteroidota bacterium]
MRQPAANPLAGIHNSLLAGASLVSGTIAASVGGPWFLWAPLFGLAAIFALKR